MRGETAALRNAVQAQSSVGTVILDLTRVTAIDAGGLGVMLQLREQAQEKGIDLKLMNVTKLVNRQLEITRLNSVFQVTSGAEILSTVSRDRPASLVQLPSCT